MATLGAALARIAPGEVEIAWPFRADLAQQHGFLHAGILATMLDSALVAQQFAWNVWHPGEDGVFDFFGF